METNQTKLAVQSAINTHASILNNADVNKVYPCYSNDAIFTPEGYKKLYYNDIMNLKSGNFLKNSQFQISYEFENIIIDGSYAFVNAAALTKTKEGNSVITRRSSDFFVLKLIEADWKIYRHTFNNVVEIQN